MSRVMRWTKLSVACLRAILPRSLFSDLIKIYFLTTSTNYSVGSTLTEIIKILCTFRGMLIFNKHRSVNYSRATSTPCTSTIHLLRPRISLPTLSRARLHLHLSSRGFNEHTMSSYNMGKYMIVIHALLLAIQHTF